MSISAVANLSLVVKPLSGSECYVALSYIGKITYSGDSIYVYDESKEVVFSDLCEKVQHIRFSEEQQPSTPTDVENLAGNQTTQVIVYPNPTQELLCVKNTQAEVVRLYSMTGRLMQTAKVQDGEAQLNVSTCPTGNYVLLCGNEAFKVIKK